MIWNYSARGSPGAVVRSATTTTTTSTRQRVWNVGVGKSSVRSFVRRSCPRKSDSSARGSCQIWGSWVSSKRLIGKGGPAARCQCGRSFRIGSCPSTCMNEALITGEGKRKARGEVSIFLHRCSSLLLLLLLLPPLHFLYTLSNNNNSRDSRPKTTTTTLGVVFFSWFFLISIHPLSLLSVEQTAIFWFL